jgi:hypothetical protein
MSVREKCDEKRGEGSPSVSVIDLPGPLLEKREKWGTRRNRRLCLLELGGLDVQKCLNRVGLALWKRC